MENVFIVILLNFINKFSAKYIKNVKMDHNFLMINTYSLDSIFGGKATLQNKNNKLCIRSYNLNLTYYNSKAFLQEVFPFFFLQECLDCLKQPY